MKVDGMGEGGGPILSQKTRAVQEGASFHAEAVVVYLDGAVLRGAIRAGGFKDVLVVL